MSDFVAVLKRTIEGLGETTPEMRQRVYDKARKTISAKLEAMNPPPSALVVGRQRRALEDAITDVENGFRKSDPKPPEPLDELEQVLNSLNGLKNQPVIPPKPPVSRPAEPVAPVTPRPVTTPVARPAAPQPTVSARPQPTPPSVPTPVRETKQPEPAFGHDDGFDDDFSEQNDIDAQERPAPIETLAGSADRNRSGRFGKIGIAAVLLAAIGVGAYAGWTNRAQLTEMVSSFTGSDPVSEPPAPTPAQPEPPATEVAATPQPEAPAPAEPPATTAPAQTGPVKFTQRLNADGTEADAGPADGGTSVGEGTSVAAATEGAATPPAAETAKPRRPAAEAPAPEPPAPVPPAPAEGATPPVDAATAPAPAAETPAPAEPAAPAAQPGAVAVAQKAIFYEERTSNVEGSAETGNVVWSVVQESPGADQPPEPAIRAEATIPSKDIQLRMTIRRNADKTLPASHIVEMIFLTPPGLEGGGVANVLRVALKGSEQDPGTPLAGIPAKISDGFFLVALNDTAADIANNTGLLRQRSWIDVPLVYASGRRALITMEKGIPGEKVFEDVLKAWGVPSSG